MEAVTEKLLNVVSHSKESIPITITGRITNKDGTFTERLEQPIQLDESANYHVYLNDFTGWSNVPNVNETNKMFYYTFKKADESEPVTPVTPIEFPISTQSVDTYNAFLENVFLKRVHWTRHTSASFDTPDGEVRKVFPVKFSYDLTVMRVIMHIAKNCSVEFKDDTWHSELGFEKKVYKAGIHLAPNMADIVKSLNILIKTNLSTDWIFKGKRTNILYNIINNIPAGMLIAERPNPVKRIVLNNKNFHQIELKFETEDAIPVSFNGEEFVMTVIIERM